MVIEFDFEMKDWIEFQKYYLKTSKQFNRSKIIITAIVPLIFCILLVLKLIRNDLSLIEVAVFVIISVLWIMLYPKRFYNKVLDKARKMLEEGDNSGIFGRHKVTLTDEGIIHTEPESEQNIKWSGIKKLAESDEYYFLYNTPVSAIIIPKPKNETDLKQLDKILKSRIAIY